jgi:hypothetical protein
MQKLRRKHFCSSLNGDGAVMGEEYGWNNSNKEFENSYLMC